MFQLTKRHGTSVSQGLSSLAGGDKMRDPGNEVGTKTFRIRHESGTISSSVKFKPSLRRGRQPEASSFPFRFDFTQPTYIVRYLSSIWDG